MWQNRLGGYCVGLDEAVPVRVMVCLDDGDDMDLLERTTGVRVFSLERAAGRRQLLDDEGIERLMPAVAEQVARRLGIVLQPTLLSGGLWNCSLSRVRVV